MRMAYHRVGWVHSGQGTRREAQEELTLARGVGNGAPEEERRRVEGKEVGG